MKKGWEKVPLAEAVFLQEGPGIRSYEYQDGGYPMINVRCVQDGYIDLSTCNSANVELATGKWKHFQVAEGDILFTISGSIGRAAVVRAEHLPLLMNTSVVRFRSTTPRLRDDFFFYYLQSEDFLGRLHAKASGTAQKNVGPTHLKTLDVPLPPLAEQQRIVGVLDEAFAGLATAQAHAAQNLKNARALFESHLQSVFTHRGKGWVEKTLEEISTTFGRGKSKHRPRNAPHLYGGKYPFVQTGDIRNADHTITEYSQTYSEVGLAQSKLWPKGTICITIAANIAETAILGFDACFPDSVIGVVANPQEADVGFIEYLLQSFKARIQAMGKGSAQANINMGTFEHERFPFPPVAEQKRIVTQFDALAAETQRLTRLYEQKQAALAALKKSLLHQAFTGEL